MKNATKSEIIWSAGMIAIIEKMANVTVTITIKPETPQIKPYENQTRNQ
jgi:hypothetical protein